MKKVSLPRQSARFLAFSSIVPVEKNLYSNTLATSQQARRPTASAPSLLPVSPDSRGRLRRFELHTRKMRARLVCRWLGSSQGRTGQVGKLQRGSSRSRLHVGLGGTHGDRLLTSLAAQQEGELMLGRVVEDIHLYARVQCISEPRERLDQFLSFLYGCGTIQSHEGIVACSTNVLKQIQSLTCSQHTCDYPDLSPGCSLI